MVDFNNETTITTAPKDVVKIIFLERRKYLLDAIEYVHKHKQRGVDLGIDIFSSRLLSLFLELIHPLKTYYDKNKYEELKKKVYSNKYEELEEAYILIDEWFYNKRLTKIDNIIIDDEEDDF